MMKKEIEDTEDRPQLVAFEFVLTNPPPAMRNGMLQNTYFILRKKLVSFAIDLVVVQKEDMRF